MPKELLDFERVRRNFDRMRDPIPEALPDRLAEVRAPLDPFAAGRQALEILSREVLGTFPDRNEALVPFLDRAARLIARMDTLEGGARDETEEAEDPADLRAELVTTLENLEDLCEVFAQTGGRR